MNTGLTRQLIILAFPLVLSNLAYTFLGAVDTIFMGRVSTTSLGAVGLANMMFLTVSLFFRGTINGTTVFVARMYGSGDHVSSGRYLQYFLFLSIIISPIILILPWLFQNYLLLLKPDAQVAKEVLIYTNIRLLELPFSLLTTAIIGFMIGVGNSKTPMILSWISVLINTVANYVLIFGLWGFPPLGIAGAAWGTVFAVFIQLILALLILKAKYGQEYFLYKWHFPSFRTLREILKVGFPIGVTDGVELAAFTTFLALISRLGTVELAASQIANQVSAIAFMPGFALGAATGALVGQFMGAGQLQTAESIGYRGAILGALSMGSLGVLFWLLSAQLGRIFTTDPQVLELTGTLLRLMAIYQLFDGINIVSRGALNGAGDTRFTMVTTIFTAWLLFIPSVYIFSMVLNWGLIGAWLGAILYLLTAAFIFLSRFRQGKWKQISLSRE